MGGKQKQAQRTKNNARPSSSGRSAELLGNSIPQFSGFSTLKDTCFSLPSLTLASTDELSDSLLDSNFQLVMKKMNKKDSTTKLKALQEFTELVSTTDQDTVKNILIYWSRLYNMLSTDVDHKVREATHSAHHQVVVKAKRNLAPYLKQLAGPWFTSQYDTYAPAASAATRSFEEAFSPSKTQEAIVFCQDEILNYVYDNLVVQTVQSLNSNLKASTEDAEAKYERIVISSLQGYSLYLRKVGKENIERAAELNKRIISNSKLWKFSKSKVVPIRSAFFGLLSILCQKASFLLENEVVQLMNTVFIRLDETEPTVLPYIWEAVLLSITTFKEWHKHISIEKIVQPKLYKVLREAGGGNAVVICHNMLPFLSNLPSSMNGSGFYYNFFENMRIGLQQRSTISSRSEFGAISTTLVECLQYIVMKNQENNYLCEGLIRTQLMPALQWCLTEGPVSSRSFFTQIALLLQYWHRNRYQEEFSQYERYLQYLWSNIGSLFDGVLVNVELNYGKSAFSDLARRQIELLLSLKHSMRPRRQMKVKFEAETSLQDFFNKDVKVESDGCDELYYSSLNSLVFKLCQSYIKFINVKRCGDMLEHLYSLVLTFDIELFEKITQVMSESEQHWKPISIYDTILSKWLETDYLQTNTVIHLIFVLIKHLEEDDQLRILEEFSKLDSHNYGWCIVNALSFPYCNEPVIQRWLSNYKVDEYLASIATSELIEGNSTPESSLLLKKAFTEYKGEELFISQSAVYQVTYIISTCLLNPADHPLTLDACARFAAYISSALYTEELKLRYRSELLLTLFTLSCNSRLDLETITEDTLWEVNTAWQDVIGTLSSCLPTDRLEFLTTKLATIIENEFFNNDVEVFNSEEIGDKIANFMRIIRKSKFTAVSKFLEIFLEREFLPKWRSDLTQLCICSEYIQGNLSSLYEPLEGSIINVENEEILKYFAWLSLRMNVLLTPVDDFENSDEEEEEEKEENREDSPKTVHTVIDVSDNVNDVIINLLYDVTLAGIIKDYKTLKSYSRLVEMSSTFVEKLKILITHIDSKTDIERILMERVANDGWLWAKVIHLLNSEITQETLADVYCDYLNKEHFQDEVCQSRVHLTQAFADSISFDDVLCNTYLAERIVTVRSLIHQKDVDASIEETFRLMQSFKITSGGNIYNLDLSKWKRNETLIEIMRLCSLVLRKNASQILKREYWDFIVISLASWSTKLPELRAHYQEIQVASFLSAIVELFGDIEAYIKDVQEHFPENEYIQEWQDVFAHDVHIDILSTWMYLAERFYEQYKIESPNIASLCLLQQFGSSIKLLKSTYIFKQAPERCPSWSKILKMCCNLLTHPLHILQIWGYHMIMVLVPGFLSIDSLAVSPSEQQKKQLVMEQFKDSLVRTQDVVHTILIDFKLGENSCRVKPYTDSYTYTFAYLLLWDVLLTMCEKSSGELKDQYSSKLKKDDFLNNLITNIFKLIPAEVLHGSDTKMRPFDEWFTKKFEITLTESTNSSTIERIVCWLYFTLLIELPASVRQWWSNTETRVNQVADKITSVYVSPHLCNLELADVARHENKFKNMAIKIHPGVREVVALYTIDEAEMDLVITLPTNYPLTGPDVQCNKQIWGTTHKQWLMQFKMCILHKNGRIWDGLSLWNSNLDKKFDGIEECYICFAILHLTTYQLPKLSCQTCKKKFHSVCLYKWFSTSNKSTCPICRNLF